MQKQIFHLLFIHLLFFETNAQIFIQSANNGSIIITPNGLRGNSENNIVSNVAFGTQTLNNNTTGHSNTGNGNFTLFANTIGNENTAIGYKALYSNTTGGNNVANGVYTLNFNTTGSSNIANGAYALYSNTTGNSNTAIGSSALFNNTTGYYNVAIGATALQFNTTGSLNTAIGTIALNRNTSGIINTAIGISTLYYNTIGSNNTSNGYQSLYFNTTGNYNTAIGRSSGSTNTIGSNNTFLGANADASVNNLENATAIGYAAIVNSSNKVVIGNPSATMIGGYGTWTNYSDLRLKENIIYTNRLGLEFIMKLQTVSYNYLDDNNKRRRDGLIAQDVQKIMYELNVPFSGLIEDQDQQKTLNLSYSELVIPLINAIQELKRENDFLKKTIQKVDKLESDIVDLKNLLRK